MNRLPSLFRQLGLACLLGLAMSSTASTVRAEEAAQVTFSGYQRGRGGEGTLFVHLSRRTELAVTSEANRVTVKLIGASIDVRNNRHPLDLSHFNVLLVSSRMVEVGSDVELKLELRHPAKLEPQWIERQDGALSLHVSLPAP